jgi:hypothetical protein
MAAAALVGDAMRRHRGYTDTCGWTIERDEDAFDIEVRYRVEPYDPGQSFGPPEDCYPAEGGGVELLAVTHNGLPFELTEAEEDALTLWLEENPEPPQEWEE